MNDLTLCLVTKGRSEYLEVLLDSLDRALRCEQVKVLIILNGVNQEISARFRLWSENASEKVTLLSFSKNEAGLSQFWSIISNISSKWVVFPSDDDILDEGFFKEWIAFESAHSNFGAIATNLELIGSEGLKLGVTRSPSHSNKMMRSEFIAKALSECPFLWPGLIMQVAKLPKQIPNSRYVLDWWIGLYLLLSTEVAVSSSTFVSYRVHNTQESAVASNARKNLEASIHIEDLVTGNIFADWIAGATAQDVIDFLQFLLRYPPVYGDPRFSGELTSRITRVVSRLRSEIEIQICAQFVNALSHGVVIDLRQLKFLGIVIPISDSVPNAFNFNIELNNSVCSVLRLWLNAGSSSVAGFPNVIVGCRHSAPATSQVELDCELLNDAAGVTDSLLIKTGEHLESLEFFVTSVSPFEYGIVRKFRLFKNRMPRPVKKLVYTLFGR